MKNGFHQTLVRFLLTALALALLAFPASQAGAQSAGPTMLVPNLGVRAVTGGLITPASLAFIGPNDLFIAEKNTGRVLRVTNGVVQGVVLDLAVNFASERGLLGLALHPNFPTNPGVYLYWTASTTGADSGVLAETPLLGNRVDRFVWNGSTLTQDINLVQLRAFQADAGQPLRGNHDGGKIVFGQDGKLYTITGDLGRRGQMQNLPCGPTLACPGTVVADDQFGGPEPDNAHLTGVVLRLNDDGTAPTDNPFYAAGAAMGGEVGANLKKVFAYGVRNSFGLAVDPFTGNLWNQENGDDSFDEINLVEKGMNGGWIQVIGPVSRVQQFKSIEVNEFGRNLQQIRWPPSNIADTPAEALARMFMLPGAHYSDPEFSWKYAVPPAGIGFMSGRGLGAQYEGDLFAGAATPNTVGGYLFRFNLTGNRQKIAVDDPRLADRVADNLTKHDITESESLLVGRDFGVVTDIVTGPNGNLFVLSLSKGTLYEVFRK